MDMNVFWVPEDIPGPGDLAERCGHRHRRLAFESIINFEQEGLTSFTRVTATTTTIAVILMMAFACWTMRRGDFR